MIESIINALAEEGVSLSHKKDIPCGVQLKFSNGAVVNCFTNGTVNIQGKQEQKERTSLILRPFLSSGSTKSIQQEQNRKVFVVYGHDKKARVELEAMLRRWDLEPIILDQLASSGQTIIEKLEEHTSQVKFGIVLATPDDIGYAKDEKDKKKYRVRQNVVLELGMLLAKIGRSRVAILLNTKEELERPSDINGLIYIPFKENIEEVGLSLAKEMSKHEYHLDIPKL